ncbi:hypothetical protein BGZ76_010205 [Entomortierella beljakovae]|nr:hypothetical protein BGZ76_010205 [Entomortierella beljakovae]
MAIFYKLVIIATAALATLAAPIDIASTPSATIANVRQTSAQLMSGSEQTVISAESIQSPFTGRGTWFTDSTGSCGTPFNTNDLIVALNEHQMGDKKMCGRKVQIRYGGKTVIARITDTCPSQYCAPGALDLSQAVFQQFAPLSKGVINIEWDFV